MLGTACGLGVQGSGWVAGDGIVVTNAHVVAGQDDTTVQLRGEGQTSTPRRSGSTPATTSRCCARPPSRGAGAAAARDADGHLGGDPRFPENGPYHVAAARLGHTATVVTQDAYGRGPVRRAITSLRGRVRPGNSGGPVVDGSGGWSTTIFAAHGLDGGRSGFGVPDSIVATRSAGTRGPVDTGPCALVARC